jgi:hypothetical protein
MAMQDQVNATTTLKRVPWNKAKLTGAKPPLRTQTRLVNPNETSD